MILFAWKQQSIVINEMAIFCHLLPWICFEAIWPLPFIYIPHPREIIRHITTTLENRFVFCLLFKVYFRSFSCRLQIQTRIFFSTINCKLKIFQLIFFINSYFVIFKFCLSFLGEMLAASFFKKKIITNIMFKSKILFT